MELKRALLHVLSVAGIVTTLCAATGCVTVRPEQRSVLADPIMQYDDESAEAVQLQHVLENREGSFGGGSVKGGGCGCN